jgi:hypothetical protein
MSRFESMNSTTAGAQSVCAQKAAVFCVCNNLGQRVAMHQKGVARRAAHLVRRRVQVEQQKLGLLLRALQRVAVRAAQEARVLRPERSGKLPRERARRRSGVLRLRAAGSELEEARAARPVAQQRRGHEPEHRMNDLCKSTQRRLSVAARAATDRGSTQRLGVRSAPTAQG